MAAHCSYVTGTQAVGVKIYFRLDVKVNKTGKDYFISNLFYLNLIVKLLNF